MPILGLEHGNIYGTIGFPEEFWSVVLRIGKEKKNPLIAAGFESVKNGSGAYYVSQRPDKVFKTVYTGTYEISILLGYSNIIVTMINIIYSGIMLKVTFDTNKKICDLCLKLYKCSIRY